MIARSAQPWKAALLVLTLAACAPPMPVFSEPPPPARAPTVISKIPDPVPLVPLSVSPRASIFVDDDALTLHVARRVKTGVLPKSVAINPNGTQQWVGNVG
jgi:hypothetical protein